MREKRVCGRGPEPGLALQREGRCEGAGGRVGAAQRRGESSAGRGHR